MRAPWTLQELGSERPSLYSALQSTHSVTTNSRDERARARLCYGRSVAIGGRHAPHRTTGMTTGRRDLETTARQATQHRTHARRWREPVPKASTKGQALSAYNTIQRASEANLIERHPRSGAVCRADSDEMRMVQGSWHPSRQCRSSLLRPPSRSGHQRENPSC